MNTLASVPSSQAGTVCFAGTLGAIYTHCRWRISISVSHSARHLRICCNRIHYGWTKGARTAARFKTSYRCRGRWPGCAASRSHVRCTRSSALVDSGRKKTQRIHEEENNTCMLLVSHESADWRRSTGSGFFTRNSSSGKADMKAGSMAWRKSKPWVAQLWITKMFDEKLTYNFNKTSKKKLQNTFSRVVCLCSKWKKWHTN